MRRVPEEALCAGRTFTVLRPFPVSHFYRFLRSLVPACTCLPPLIPLPPSLPDPEQGPSTALIGSRHEANWMRPCMAASLIFMSSCQSHPRERSKGPWPPAHYLVARLGNCADGRLGACCLSSLQSLELRRAIFPSPRLRGAWRGASRWRQSGGGGDR